MELEFQQWLISQDFQNELKKYLTQPKYDHDFDLNSTNPEWILAWFLSKLETEGLDTRDLTNILMEGTEGYLKNSFIENILDLPIFVGLENKQFHLLEILNEETFNLWKQSLFNTLDYTLLDESEELLF